MVGQCDVNTLFTCTFPSVLPLGKRRMFAPLCVCAPSVSMKRWHQRHPQIGMIVFMLNSLTCREPHQLGLGFVASVPATPLMKIETGRQTAPSVNPGRCVSLLTLPSPPCTCHTANFVLSTIGCAEYPRWTVSSLSSRPD